MNLKIIVSKKEPPISGCHFQVNHVKLWEGTPRKINIEPEHDGLEDVFTFPVVYSWVNHVNLPGCRTSIWPNIIFHQPIWVFPKIVVPPNHPF